MRIPEPDEERFRPRVYRSEKALAVVAPTWEVSTKFGYEDFVEAYRRNPRLALRDFASVPSFSVEAFFREPEILDMRANKAREDPVDELGSFASWFLPTGRWHYYLHFDMSARRDATGVAMSHWEGDRRREVDGVGQVKGQVVVDFCMRIIPEPGRDIDFDRLEQIVYILKNRGFFLARVTFDQFQSFNIIQNINKRGIVAELFSVDRNTGPYDTFLEMMLQGKTDYYPHPWLIQELKKLIIKDGKKVDHPSGGSKDVSDAVVATVAQAVEAAGTEPYSTSQSVEVREVKIVKEDESRRQDILGFRDTTTILL